MGTYNKVFPVLFYPTLINVNTWLKENNPLFTCYKYSHINSNPNSHDSIHTPFLTTTQYTPTTQVTSDIPQLNIPNYLFPPKNNEDYRYNHLLASSIETNNCSIPISYNNPNLEAILFSDLFSTGKDHYEDLKTSLFLQSSTKTYSKYIKLRMLCPDARFRLHWYWPHWSYLNLEKNEIFKIHTD